jgi:phage tail protein X
MVKLTPETGEPVTLILTGAPERTGSVGGWETSERVLRPDASWWKSRPLGAVSLPCVLDIDALPDTDPIEGTLRTLYLMGHHRGTRDPPGIRLTGDVPHCEGQTWRLDDMHLADRIYRSDRDRLRQQKLTLDLTELRALRTVGDVDIRRSRKHGRRRRREIRTHRGDTLRSLAVRYLGQQSQWRDIRKWNPGLAKRHVDPDERLRRGTKIVLH